MQVVGHLIETKKGVVLPLQKIAAVMSRVHAITHTLRMIVRPCQDYVLPVF